MGGITYSKIQEVFDVTCTCIKYFIKSFFDAHILDLFCKENIVFEETTYSAE